MDEDNEVPVRMHIGVTPPKLATSNVLWLDTSSVPDSHILKYWDGHNEYLRMDGGGSLPFGMIVDRHIASNAAINPSKIANSERKEGTR